MDPLGYGMHIRQIALVARDLEPTVAALCDALGVDICHRDPGVGEFGLHNALMTIGDTFLEVVSPTRDGTTAGRLLQRRGGDGGYMVIFETDDLPAARARVAAAQVRTVWEIELPDISTIHLHPRDIGAAIVSIDQPTPAGEWRWAGPSWRDSRRTDRVISIVGAELAAVDPLAMATRWAEVLGLGAPEAIDGGRYRVALASGELRFAPVADDRGEGLTTFDVQGAAGQSPADLELCGTRIRIV